MESIANNDIRRFVEAQESSTSGYCVALTEILFGEKESHWMWYIFPQLRCLGHSWRADYYGIADRAEAQRYLDHPLLGSRLREITTMLLMHDDRNIVDIVGYVDALKVRSCMTLFDQLSPNDLFDEALRRFFGGERCEVTLAALQDEVSQG